ncbi:helix-turn-helix domain-containing protein [Bacillus weihaiensis]|uniref:helix-turn-helix domain-containing protein n=1 Tax=Bacillus weihaiensis TaxID=1547283 RepID=UPI002353A200|nr:helix-turn-helix domain-containing protein [Bacillus weihaiensis]
MNERKEITSREAAELLNVKITTIQKYVREKRLVPSNEASWHIDNRKYFYEDDILKLKKELAKPGYTTGEIAKKLNLHPVTVSQYVSKGLLKAEKHIYRGREISFISPEEYERFSNEYQEKKRAEKKEFYNKDTEVAWFQSFSKSDGTFGRILIEENSPILVTSEGSRVAINDMKSAGFTPRISIEDHSYSSKKGYARFEFPYEEDINYPIYDFIEICYKHIGFKNIKIGLNNSSIILEIKPYLFSYALLPQDFMKQLELYLKDGKIIPSKKGLFVNSDYEILTFSAPSLLKKEVKKISEENNLTIEELLLRIVAEYISENK